MEKQPAVRVSRLSTFAFLYCAGMHGTLLTGLSAAGLLGVAVDKVTRCVAIPALSAIREWHGQAGVSCAAKSSVSFLLCKKKDCSTWVLPSKAVLFMYYDLSAIAALYPPRDCFRRKSARQLPFSFASLL